MNMEPKKDELLPFEKIVDLKPKPCPRCGSKSSHRENRRDYCNGCGADIGPAFTAEAKTP
jgi:ribosomal protein S27AE